MSALETFVRIRQFKERAAEFFELAAQPDSEEVRARYLAIADHYVALADAEMRADRLARKKRLDHMRAERQRSQHAEMTPAVDPKTGPPVAPLPLNLHNAKGANRPAQRGSAGPAQMAAQAEFPAVKSAP